MRSGRRRFCAARVDGQLSVLDGICPHKELPLGKGHVEKGCVVCPWHGWTFDLKTGQQTNGKAQLRTYPAAIEDGEVLVTISKVD